MSEFKFACPVCGQHITCDSAGSGKQMDCPTCFRKLVVPQAKAAGSSNLVLTAALVQSRPATSLSSQTDFIASRPPAAKKVPVVALTLMVLVVCAGAGVFAFRKVIFGTDQPPSPVPNQPAQPAKPVMPVIAPAPDATNWTLSLAEARIPAEPASGNVNGRVFRMERATIQQGRLDLRQGPKWPPDVGVSVHLFAERTEDLAGKTVVIEATRTNAPRTILRWKNEQGEPVTKDQHQGYALRVEFGQVTNNHLPGRIFIAFTDEPKSYAAGTFNAEIRKPSPKK
ncbi:MAG: hypothetical protein U1F83_20435 [Verrucomicrobiota bacterium]